MKMFQNISSWTLGQSWKNSVFKSKPNSTFHTTLKRFTYTLDTKCNSTNIVSLVRYVNTRTKVNYVLGRFIISSNNFLQGSFIIDVGSSPIKVLCKIILFLDKLQCNGASSCGDIICYCISFPKYVNRKYIIIKHHFMAFIIYSIQFLKFMYYLGKRSSVMCNFCLPNQA